MSSGPPLGSRENFWGEDETDPGHPSSGHGSNRGPSKEAWLSHDILKNGGQALMLCPHCAHPLTEPLVYVDPQAEGDRGDPDGKDTPYVRGQKHRICLNADCSYISFGGQLADRPVEEFVSLLDAILDAIDRLTGLPPSHREELWEAAHKRKRSRMNDERNIAQLLHEVEWGVDD